MFDFCMKSKGRAFLIQWIFKARQRILYYRYFHVILKRIKSVWFIKIRDVTSHISNFKNKSHHNWNKHRSFIIHTYMNMVSLNNNARRIFKCIIHVVHSIIHCIIWPLRWEFTIYSPTLFVASHNDPRHLSHFFLIHSLPFQPWKFSHFPAGILTASEKSSLTAKTNLINVVFEDKKLFVCTPHRIM